MRSVETPLGIFPSTASAAVAHNISPHVLRRRLKSEKFQEFKYLSESIIVNKDKNSNQNSKGSNNPMARRVMTPLGPYETLMSAAAALNISIIVLNNRCRSDKFNDYYYLESKVKRIPRKNPGTTGKNSGTARRIMTPIGAFDTVREAHKALGIDVTTIYNRMKNKEKNPGYYYL
jgi:hypothetical protein